MKLVLQQSIKWAVLLAVAVWGPSPDDALAVDYVTIPQDPAGGGFQAWPDLVRLGDGRLMCLFYNGYAHGSPNNAQFPNAGRIDYSISTNSGYSWSTPQALYDGPADDHDASITQLNSGRLMVNFFIDYYAGYTGTPTGSSGPMFMTSDDLGKHWSTPQHIAPAPYFSSSPIRELSNGRLVAPIYYQTGSNATNGEAFGAVALSDNQGATWSQPINIPRPPAGQQQWLCAETDVIELKDAQGRWSGNLYAAQRTNFNDMYFSTSADFGNTWSQSQDIGFSGHAPYLHRTPNDIILLAFRDYSRGTTSLRYSLNECQTWSSEVVVDTVGGAYPSITDLEDGSALIAYYEEGAGSNIRVKRFLATPAGIQWLPVTPMPEPGTISLLIVATGGFSLYTCKKSGFLVGRRNSRLGV